MTADNVKHFYSWFFWNLKESSLLILHFQDMSKEHQVEIEVNCLPF